MGVESGSDEVLTQVEKGVTGDEHIAAGKKAHEAGPEVCAYVMPGLGAPYIQFVPPRLIVFEKSPLQT